MEGRLKQGPRVLMNEVGHPGRLPALRDREQTAVSLASDHAGQSWSTEQV